MLNAIQKSCLTTEQSRTQKKWWSPGWYCLCYYGIKMVIRSVQWGMSKLEKKESNTKEGSWLEKWAQFSVCKNSSLAGE